MYQYALILALFDVDSLVFSNGQWYEPGGTSLNDFFVGSATTRICPALDGAVRVNWTVQGRGTGAPASLFDPGSQPMFGCPLAGGSVQLYDWFDSSGTKHFTSEVVLAWNADDAKLAGEADSLSLVDAAGNATKVTNLPASAAVAWRSQPHGFWVAAKDVDLDLFFVDGSGVATKVGAYAQPPAGTGGFSSVVIDSGGALYSIGSQGATGVIVRQPLLPEAASIVESGTLGGCAGSDLTVSPPKACLAISGGMLVSTP